MAKVSGQIAGYWKTVMNTVNDAVMIVSPAGEILDINRAAEEITGYSSQELVGQTCDVLDCTGCNRFGPDQGPHWCSLFRAGTVNAKRCELTAKGGQKVHVIKRATVLKNEKGELLGAVEALADISQAVANELELVSLRGSLGLEEGFHGIIGHAAQMRMIFDLIHNVAGSDVPVLILGESGTGKELIARAIHRLGPRAQRPFIKVNCAALNESVLESELFGHVKGAFTGAERARVGRFEAAQGGDLFLDEFGDVPAHTQVKLLRFLEDKVIERVGDNQPIKLDVRVIAATNRDLGQLMAQGKFRQDLFYRVNVVPIEVPPLRERREDIPLLARSFLETLAKKTGKIIEGFTPQAMDLLYRHHWPGNVRELRNAIEYALVICNQGLIDEEHLPTHIGRGDQAAPPAEARRRNGREELIEVLRQVEGNQSQAARVLGVSRMTIWKRMKRYDINISRDVR